MLYAAGLKASGIGQLLGRYQGLLANLAAPLPNLNLDANQLVPDGQTRLALARVLARPWAGPNGLEPTRDRTRNMPNYKTDNYQIVKLID